MKKNSTAAEQAKKRTPSGKPEGKRRKREQITIGLDLGDKSSRYCAIDANGEVLMERSVATTQKGMAQAFGALARSRVALEVGTHSPWVSRQLSRWGHEVIVANARQVKLISESSRKDDKLDAQTLARLARLDAGLLRPIRHRSERAQGHLLTIRVRAALLEARTSLINTARGLAKSYGERLPACGTAQMGVEKARELPAVLQEALQPLLVQVAALTAQIQGSDRKVEQIARSEYPETARLKQVSGVGDLIATTYVLTVEDPRRFARSRDAGCYVGLRPRRSESGQSRPQLRITKEGDPYLRKLLVQGAHYILGWRGPDTDLRRWGLKLAERGGKNAKKRAIVAVARKLAVLLHRLWVSGERYEPLRQSRRKEAAHAAA
jgi:transposase